MVKVNQIKSNFTDFSHQLLHLEKKHKSKISDNTNRNLPDNPGGTLAQCQLAN